ncbi:MAG: hypothetical protein WAN46_07480 [Gammaproteobacteria bacterium]
MTILRKKHLDFVEGFNGSLDDLARAIGRMRYDATAELFEKLADEFRRKADDDAQRGRAQLSQQLSNAGSELQYVRFRFEHIWKICESHMDDEEAG